MAEPVNAIALDASSTECGAASEPPVDVASRARDVAVTMSVSRMRRMTQCPRQEWWHTQGARGGWARDADALAREAWAARCATSLPAVLGQAVHEAAAMLARALRDGRRPPPYDALLTHVRGRLAQVWRARDAAAFRRRPARDRFLLERLRGDEVDATTVEAIRVRLPAVLRRLVAHPVWDHVKACGRGDVVVVDALDALLVDLPGGSVQLYCAPDLVYVSRVPLEVPDLGVPMPAGTAVLVDWKTGRAGDALAQLALYAYFARERLRLSPGPLGYVGRVGDLYAVDDDPLGGQVVVIGDAEIDRARDRVARHAAQVRAWTGRDGRLVRDRMPPVDTACRYCAFTAVCEVGQTSDATSPRGPAAARAAPDAASPSTRGSAVPLTDSEDHQC